MQYILIPELPLWPLRLRVDQRGTRDPFPPSKGLSSCLLLTH
jgi:hypothetical protein